MTDDSVWQSAPQCTFYIRKQVTSDPATYDYAQVYLRGGPLGGGGSLDTPHPPMAGDLIWLQPDRSPGGCYRVIERAWQHAAYGSANWPFGVRRTAVGPILTIVVEPDDGPFRDEAPGDSEAEL